MKLTLNNAPLKTLTVFVISLSLSTTLFSADAVYKQQQPDGSFVYTDQPNKDIPQEKMELAPITTIPAIKPSRVNTQPDNTQSKPVDYTVSISSPSQQANYRNAQADAIPLSYNISPDISPRSKVEVSVDGKTIAPDSKNLPMLYRGEHSVQVRVLTKDGKELSSAKSTFFVHRFAGG